MRLHMAASPLTALEDRSDEQNHCAKPRGLWYGFGPSWLEWCESEQPDWVHEHWYEVELAPQARVLRLATRDEVRDFAENFRIERYPSDRFALNWPLVAMMYDAVEIQPYHHDLRFETDLSWYYGWDVASGCVWRPTAFSLRPTNRPALEGAA